MEVQWFVGFKSNDSLARTRQSKVFARLVSSVSSPLSLLLLLRPTSGEILSRRERRTKGEKSEKERRKNQTAINREEIGDPRIPDSLESSGMLRLESDFFSATVNPTLIIIPITKKKNKEKKREKVCIRDGMRLR